MEGFVSDFVSKYPGARSCFVLGSTGETGKRLVKLLVSSGAFSLVKVVSRRQVPQDNIPEPPAGVKVVRHCTSSGHASFHSRLKEQVIVKDFATLADDSDILKGCE